MHIYVHLFVFSLPNHIAPRTPNPPLHSNIVIKLKKFQQLSKKIQRKSSKNKNISDSRQRWHYKRHRKMNSLSNDRLLRPPSHQKSIEHFTQITNNVLNCCFLAHTKREGEREEGTEREEGFSCG